MKKWRWRSLISWDLGAGVVAAVGMYLAAAWQAATFRTGASTIFVTEAVTDAAILAVVLASLTILATFTTEEYLVVLDHAPSGVAGAFYQYKIVAVISAAALLFGLAGSVLFLVPIGNEVFVRLYLAITAGLTVWAVVGAVQLVFLTAFHGIERANLELILHQKKADARKRVS